MASLPLGDLVCGGCTACCRGNQLVLISPSHGDRLTDYEGHYVTFEKDGVALFALERRPNGDCAYLGEFGCTIYDKRPAVCREFDCRKWVLRLQAMSRNERRVLRKHGYDTSNEVMAAGRVRLP